VWAQHEEGERLLLVSREKPVKDSSTATLHQNRQPPAPSVPTGQEVQTQILSSYRSYSQWTRVLCLISSPCLESGVKQPLSVATCWLLAAVYLPWETPPPLFSLHFDSFCSRCLSSIDVMSCHSMNRLTASSFLSTGSHSHPYPASFPLPPGHPLSSCGARLCALILTRNVRAFAAILALSFPRIQILLGWSAITRTREYVVEWSGMSSQPPFFILEFKSSTNPWID
jgi:hypothetical protein